MSRAMLCWLRCSGIVTPKFANVIRKAFGWRSSTRRIMRVAATPLMAVPATMGTATGTGSKLPHLLRWLGAKAG